MIPVLLVPHLPWGDHLHQIPHFALQLREMLQVLGACQSGKTDQISNFVRTKVNLSDDRIGNSAIVVELDKKKIESLLPHREPMLLIDKLINIVPLKSARAVMYVKKNSFFLNGLIR